MHVLRQNGPHNELPTDAVEVAVINPYEIRQDAKYEEEKDENLHMLLEPSS